MKKAFIAVCVVLVIGIIGSYAFLYYKEQTTYTDKYGFTHNVKETDAPFVEDENRSRDYALVSMNKEEAMQMSQHEFLNKIIPILNNYSDKKYTTIVFDDGTGILFPYSSTKYVAAYGTVDEVGNIAEQKGTILISGTQITYTDINANISSQTVSVYDYVPSEFVSDDLAICVDDDTLYIALSYTALNDEAADEAVRTFISKFKYDTKSFDRFYVVLNYTYGYEVDPVRRSIDNNNNIIDETLEKVGF